MALMLSSIKIVEIRFKNLSFSVMFGQIQGKEGPYDPICEDSSQWCTVPG